MSRLDPRTPVLVGVGTASEPTEPSTLMTLAVEAAADDAGARSLLGAIDRIAVPVGTWAYRDPGRLVADRFGASGARTHLGEVGISQQTLVSQALRAIGSGRSEVAVVTGADARSWARGGGVETPQPDAVPDERHLREPEFIAPVELAAGTGAPVQQYAMIDNALRRAEGMTIAEHRAEIADLWARCNVVARSNPRAAFANPRSAHDIDTPGPANRPLAFPYNKWHASQWTVDQGAALLMCSAEAARRHGVAPERWVFPLVGIDAEHSVSLSRRRLLHRWPAMAVLGKAAAARIGRPLAEAEFIEVYSCFPAAVRVQQRELGLALDGTPTLTGGMAFAGGPFNNFVYQSTAMVVAAVRSTPGSLGVVTTVCGLLTKPGLAVWSTEPDGRPPLLDDLGPLAARATPEVTVVASHDGPATVATYTVTYDPATMAPARLAVLADTASGERCLAVADDPVLAAAATVDEFCGTTVDVRGTSFSA
ncbi:MAG: acetyl-CoA acetyltransferase [Acidimicrobiales bacterium]